MTRSASLVARLVIGLGVLLLALVAIAPRAALARDVPPLAAHVNDTAHLLSATAEQQLEQKLDAYEKQSQHQFALLTIDSLDGDALEDFSIRVVEAWKLGKRAKTTDFCCSSPKPITSCASRSAMAWRATSPMPFRRA